MQLLKHDANTIFKAPGERQLVPVEVLERASKILVITHFAIGDFAYMQSCFRALKRAYPQLAIHIWVDERRRTSNQAKWPHLKHYAVYDWLDASPWVDKVYKETYAPALRARSVREAMHEQYPIVLTLTNLDSHAYARLGRTIGKDALVVGLRKASTRRYDIVKRLGYRKLDAAIPLYKSVAYKDAGVHISDVYADWFARAFGLAIPMADRFPTLDIPDAWTRRAREQVASWGFDGPAARIVFVNTFSKCRDRCWPFERALQLIAQLRQDAAWADTHFVINVVPEALDGARRQHAAAALPGTVLFSAEENFFQLPAILALCHLVVTVETVVMHLANAVQVPVIALMRQTTPEWQPIDPRFTTILWTRAFDDWLEKIGVAEVVDVVKRHPLA